LKIEELQDQSEKDLKISIDTLEHDSVRTPQIHHKYLKELMFAKDLYTRYELDLRILKRKKWLYYSGKAKPEIYDEHPLDLKVMKSDVKMFIDSDDEVVALEYKLAFVKRKILFIEKIMDECNRRSFHITNAIKSLKFKNGEYD